MVKLAVDRLVRKQPNTQPKSELFNEVDKNSCSIENKDDIITEVDVSNLNKSDDDDEDPFEELFKDI